MSVIELGSPWAIGLAVPWTLACWWFYRLQRRSVFWIQANVSYRFRRRLTIHDQRSLALHVFTLCLMGLLLVFAMSGPRLFAKEAVANGGGRLLFVIDASASMHAEDVNRFDNDPEDLGNRFGRARYIAQRMVEELPGYEFGLVSFSGNATIHLPLTSDRILVDDALHFLELHNIYRQTGSSLTQALDTILRFVDEQSPGLQVVLLGDGELPEEEDYTEALDALVARGIPVHAVAIGSLAGQSRVIYDFRDVVAKNEEKTVLSRYHTRRVDEHFRRIAGATGGRFDLSDASTPAELSMTVKSTPVRVSTSGEPSFELDRVLFSLFTILFLLDALVYGRRAAPVPRFRLYALGDQGQDVEIEGSAVRVRASKWARAKDTVVASLLVGFLGGCSSPSWKAHVENEKGIGFDGIDQYPQAESHYLRAIGYHVRSEIPLTNLGRSKTLAGAYAEAHQHFERALQHVPSMYPAHFNDGVALFEWGESVRDPRNCEVDRTLELWQQARVRFESARDYALGDEDRAAAEANLEHVIAGIVELEVYRDDPPPECPPPPPAGGGGGGGSEDEADEKQGSPPPTAEDPQPSSRGSVPPPPTVADGGGTPPPMSGAERDRIRQLIAELREQSREEGKFYRGSRSEQFPRESWENPEPVLRW